MSQSDVTTVVHAFVIFTTTRLYYHKNTLFALKIAQNLHSVQNMQAHVILDAQCFDLVSSAASVIPLAAGLFWGTIQVASIDA